MKIKNHEVLAVSALRKAALDIAEAGFEAIDTRNAIFRSKDAYSPEVKGRIFVVAIGKCATEAAAALDEVLGERISAGVIADVKTGRVIRNFTHHEGTHPAPSPKNVAAAKAIVEFLIGKTEDDLVIFVISGGGSTLLCLPEEGDCEAEARVFEALTKKGATIQELNTVRKHSSLARGGYLAKYAYPARSISLIFSDVPGNDAEFVASGPTVKDNTSVNDAEAVLAKYGVDATGLKLIETPKEEKYFEHARNIAVVTNGLALAAMAEKAADLGFRAEIRDSAFRGEARDKGPEIAEALKAAPSGSVLLYGGETTVTVRGGGYGGRNLELALSALGKVDDGELLMSIASDGRDNKGEFAGAICDTISGQEAAAKGLSPEKFLDANDSYEFWRQVNGALETGDTGSNVSDLIVAIKKQII